MNTHRRILSGQGRFFTYRGMVRNPVATRRHCPKVTRETGATEDTFEKRRKAPVSLSKLRKFLQVRAVQLEPFAK